MGIRCRLLLRICGRVISGADAEYSCSLSDILSSARELSGRDHGYLEQGETLDIFLQVLRRLGSEKRALADEMLSGLIRQQMLRILANNT